MRIAWVIAVIIPVAVFYVVVALRWMARLVDRRYARRGGRSAQITPFPRSTEMTFAAIVLDLSILMESLRGFFGDHQGGGAFTLAVIVAGLLLLIHSQLYVFVQFFERGRFRRRIGTAGAEAHASDPLLITLGVVALFTNAFSLMTVF